jgi:hypothetical protein
MVLQRLCPALCECVERLEIARDQGFFFSARPPFQLPFSGNSIGDALEFLMKN